MYKLHGSKCITDLFSKKMALFFVTKLRWKKNKNSNYCVNKEGTNKIAVLQKHKARRQFEESLIQFLYVQHIYLSIFGRTTTIVLITHANHLFPRTLIMHSNTISLTLECHTVNLQILRDLCVCDLSNKFKHW